MFLIKKKKILISFLSFFLILINCSYYNKNSYSKRLDHFYKLLSKEEISFFKEGELKKVADSLNQNIKTNPNLEKQWNLLKKKEAINLFSVEQTIIFFYQHFYFKVNPKKTH